MRYVELFESTKPIIYYHGSSKPIENISLDFLSKDSELAKGPGVYFSSSFKDAARYGEYIHTVELTHKPKLLPERKSFSKTFIKNFIKQSPDLTAILSDWAENKVEAFQKATNQLFDIYGPYDYKEGCFAI